MNSGDSISQRPQEWEGIQLFLWGMPTKDPTIIAQLCIQPYAHAQAHALFAQSLLCLPLIRSVETGLSLSPALSSTFRTPGCFLCHTFSTSIQYDDFVLCPSFPPASTRTLATSGQAHASLHLGCLPLCWQLQPETVFLSISKAGLNNGTDSFP